MIAFPRDLTALPDEQIIMKGAAAEVRRWVPWGGQLLLTNKRLVWAPQSKFNRAISTELTEISEVHEDPLVFLGSPLLFGHTGPLGLIILSMFVGGLSPLWFLYPKRLAIRQGHNVIIYQGLKSSDWVKSINSLRI